MSFPSKISDRPEKKSMQLYMYEDKAFTNFFFSVLKGN